MQDQVANLKSKGISAACLNAKAKDRKEIEVCWGEGIEFVYGCGVFYHVQLCHMTVICDL